MDELEQRISDENDKMIKQLGEENLYWRELAVYWQTVAENLMHITALKIPNTSICKSDKG